MISADLPGLSWKISMQTSDLRKRGETGDLLFVPVSASSKTGSRGQRAAWEFLVMRAAGLDVNGCLVSREKKEKEGYVPEITAFAPIPGDARGARTPLGGVPFREYDGGESALRGGRERCGR